MTADGGDAEEKTIGDERNMIQAVDVYTDASYGSSELKSISGVVVFVGGTPVGWQDHPSTLHHLVNGRSGIDGAAGGVGRRKIHGSTGRGNDRGEGEGGTPLGFHRCNCDRHGDYVIVEDQTPEDSGGGPY